MNAILTGYIGLGALFQPAWYKDRFIICII